MKIKEVEDRAKDFVCEHERKEGRKPKKLPPPTWGKGEGYDIESSGRKIEVKGSSASWQPFVKFNQYNVKAWKKNKNFWLYVVYNIGKGKKPELRILNRNKILKERKLDYGWKIPLRKKDLENK